MGGPRGVQANYRNKDVVFQYKSYIGGIGHSVGGRSLGRMMDGVRIKSTLSSGPKHPTQTSIGEYCDCSRIPRPACAATDCTHPTQTPPTISSPPPILHCPKNLVPNCNSIVNSKTCTNSYKQAQGTPFPSNWGFPCQVNANGKCQDVTDSGHRSICIDD